MVARFDMPGAVAIRRAAGPGVAPAQVRDLVRDRHGAGQTGGQRMERVQDVDGAPHDETEVRVLGGARHPEVVEHAVLQTHHGNRNRPVPGCQDGRIDGAGDDDDPGIGEVHRPIVVAQPDGEARQPRREDGADGGAPVPAPSCRPPPAERRDARWPRSRPGPTGRPTHRLRGRRERHPAAAPRAARELGHRPRLRSCHQPVHHGRPPPCGPCRPPGCSSPRRRGSRPSAVSAAEPRSPD